MTASSKPTTAASAPSPPAGSSTDDGWPALARAILPAALLALGLRKLLTASFVPGWQPIGTGVAHGTLALADALALVALSLLALAGPRRDLGFWGLAGLLALWIVALQGPGVLAAPGVVALWLGVAEVGALVSGAVLAATPLGDNQSRQWTVRTCAFVAFGLCCLVFGTSHFVYSDVTATLVPAWLPARLAFAHATGLAHMAAGLAIATGILRRPAALALALMMGIFVALVHVPAAWATHGSLVQVTFLLNACTLTGAALTVAFAASTHPLRNR